MIDRFLKLFGLQRIRPPFGVSVETTNPGAKCKITVGSTLANGLLTVESDRIIIRDSPTPSKTFVYNGNNDGKLFLSSSSVGNITAGLLPQVIYLPGVADEINAGIAKNLKWFGKNSRKIRKELDMLNRRIAESLKHDRESFSDNVIAAIRNANKRGIKLT